MSIFKKHKKPVEDNGEVLVPEERASIFKRLESPGYLLLHPEKTKAAAILTFLRNFLYLCAAWIIACYIAVEIGAYLSLG